MELVLGCQLKAEAREAPGQLMIEKQKRRKADSLRE
jgi:hypothetical protein